MATRARRGLYALIGLVGALLLLIAALLWWVRASLPTLDGRISAPVSADVVIERDRLGTLSIRAKSRPDAAFALGFVHAQERYFEMDLMRRKTAGELAALLGSALIETDRGMRVHQLRRAAEASNAILDVNERHLCETYSAGVNAGLSALSARPWQYLLLRQQPIEWSCVDSLLVGLAMFDALQDRQNRAERAASQIRAFSPPGYANWLLTSGGSWDSPLSGGPLSVPSLPSRDQIDLRSLPPSVFDAPVAAPSGLGVGSNAFVVSGARAGGGPALLASDMHLGLGVPGIWFRQSLHYLVNGEPVDVWGVGLPGVPAMIVGSNGHVAWGITNSYGDWLDFVRLVPGQDAQHYRSASGEQALSADEEIIAVHGAPSVRMTVLRSVYGPVIGTDHDGIPLALAWTAHRAGAVNLRLAELDQAHTVSAALEVVHAAGIPENNFFFADADGHIAWTVAGKIPRRACAEDDCASAWDPTVPIDSTRLSADVWTGWLGAAEVPAIVDPPGGSLHSGNQRKVDGEALRLIGFGSYDLGARAGAIAALLAARDQHDESSLRAIQLDIDSPLLEQWRAWLRAELARRNDELAQRWLALIPADKPLRAAVDAVDYRLVRAVRSEVSKRLLTGLAGPMRVAQPDFQFAKMPQAEHLVWQLLQERPAHLCNPHFADYDALIDDALTTIDTQLSALPGGLAARTWGELNTSRIGHPLSRAVPLLSRWLDMPARQLPGDANLPRVQGPAFGASERLVVAPSRESAGSLNMPGGQSGHPMSAFYGAGHQAWEEGEAQSLLPGATLHTLRLTVSQANHTDPVD